MSSRNLRKRDRCRICGINYPLHTPNRCPQLSQPPTCTICQSYEHATARCPQYRAPCNICHQPQPTHTPIECEVQVYILLFILIIHHIFIYC